MQDDNGRPSFAGKLFRLQPRPTRDCPKEIGYREVVAYGELVYRSRLNLKTTLADLAKATGCERWRTLPKVVKRLQKHGLADEQVRALPDEKKCFHRKKTQKRRWQDQLQTTTVYRRAPDAELTDIQNSVLWTIHSFNSGGQRPYPSSVAKMLRLDCRTVTRHLQWLQEHGYLDADLSVIADPRHWQDAKPRLPGDPEVRWEEFAVEWVGSRYDDGYCQGKTRFTISRGHFCGLLRDGCQTMAQAGYTSVQIREYWEREMPEACGGGDRQLLLMEYFVCRMFWDMFDAVERVTKQNRQLGKFHGDNSLGLLRQQTAAQARAMKARLVEGGVDALETWCPQFTSLGAMRSQPRTQNVGRRTTEPEVDRHATSKLPCDNDGFDRMLSQRAPELDRAVWLPRLLGSRQFQEDPEQLYLECYQALSDLPSRQERNLERLLNGNNGQA